MNFRNCCDKTEPTWNHRGIVVAKVVREWTLHQEIGRGGMGVVWRATHEILPGHWAIKVIRPELTEDVESRQRFISEVLVLSRLRHENIIEIQTPFQEAGQLYLPMEYLSGTSIKKYLDSGASNWDVERCVDIVRRAALGIGHAHAQNPPTLHRDIKPANIQVLDDGRVKVLDFGLARTLGERSMTASGITVGTPAYMAPEVLDGKRATPASDVYSLGVVLFRLLAGRLPIDMPEDDSSVMAVLMAVVKGHQAGLPDVREFNGRVGSSVADALSRALATVPNMRPPNGNALALLLDSAIKSTNGRPGKVPASADETRIGIDINRGFGTTDSPDSTQRAPRNHQARSGTSSMGEPAGNFRDELEPPEYEVVESDSYPSRPNRLNKVLMIVGGGLAVLLLGLILVLLNQFGLLPGASDSTPQTLAITPVAESFDAAVGKDAASATDSTAGDLESARLARRQAYLTENDLAFVPEGRYRIGCDEKGTSESGCYGDDGPVHEYQTKGFGIGRHEVRVIDYQACLLAGACDKLSEKSGCNIATNRPNHPVNCISRDSAEKYCKWKGMRLPNEFEWEVAARGPGSFDFPWGNDGAECDKASLKCGNVEGTREVGQFQKDKSPFEVMDMAGNVREWTSSLYRPYPGAKPFADGVSDKDAVVRGGSWLIEVADAVRSHTRGVERVIPEVPVTDIGFRCAIDVADITRISDK